MTIIGVSRVTGQPLRVDVAHVLLGLPGCQTGFLLHQPQRSRGDGRLGASGGAGSGCNRTAHASSQMAICSPLIARRNQRSRFWLASCTVKVFTMKESVMTGRATGSQNRTGGTGGTGKDEKSEFARPSPTEQLNK